MLYKNDKEKYKVFKKYIKCSVKVKAKVHCVHAGLLSLNSDKYTLRYTKEESYCIIYKQSLKLNLN